MIVFGQGIILGQAEVYLKEFVEKSGIQLLGPFGTFSITYSQLNGVC
jgi:hypothetical protein